VDDHRCPPDSVAALTDERQRRFLTEVGLPVEDKPYWEEVIAGIWVGDYSAD
jgi:hypothetical protein